MVGVVVAAVVVAGSACGTSTSSAGGRQTLVVQVDHKSDEFASTFIHYFPDHVQLHPGDTVKFDQTWTGEPHSVTMGTSVDEFLGIALPAFAKYKSEAEAPKELVDQINQLQRAQPSMGGNAPGEVVQTAAQPCYLDSGSPPQDGSACPKRAQPAFNGRQTYYNSGFIPYQGVKGNTFTLKLSDDIKPGTYRYYCTLHGADMNGVIEVKPKTESIPPASAVALAAQKDIERFSVEPRQDLKDAAAGKLPNNWKLPIVGVPTKDVPLSINEFLPSTIQAKVGEKVTWTFTQDHTISFNVPKYFPIATVGKGWHGHYQPRRLLPVKWPGTPPDRGDPHGDVPIPPISVDAGSWDGGGGFHSSGSGWAPGDTYAVTFTKAGTYTYACVLHPPMIGKVVVK